MDQLGDGLKKMVQAGFGAVATGVEKTQGAIDRFARKGEPIYEQAKSAVTDTAGKIKKAVQESKAREMLSCRPRVDCIIRDLQELNEEELDQIHTALERIIARGNEENGCGGDYDCASHARKETQPPSPEGAAHSSGK